MADFMGEPGRPSGRSLPEALVRTLRHEIGDLLQKVYASVAILKDRLPPDKEMERGVLTRLWSRAETCKRVLDTAHDFVCRVELELQPVDLAGVAGSLVAAARERFPNLNLVAEAAGPVTVEADPRRAAQIGELLLTNACEAARSQVVLRTSVNPAGTEAQWTVTDDGPGVPKELAGNLFSPFFTTRAGHSGLGLALARKLVLFHGGRIEVGNLPQGGFQAQVVFAVKPPAAEE